MPTAPPPAADGVSPSRLLAAIDIGSNSFRLEIGQIAHGRYRRLDYVKETVRLGAGLDADGMLTDEAAARGLDCLARFAKRLGGFAPGQLRAVATQTLREAKNRNAFLARAEAVLGHPIEVISGREEARLIYAGVARLQPSDAPRLVVDIGGRSTEMIVGRGRVPAVAESFAVGSVGLSLRYFGDGRLTASAFRAAQVAAAAEFGEALATFARDRWDEALGSSGTAGAVSQLLAASRITDGTITPAGLRWCIERCLEAGRVDRLALPGLKDDRRAVIAGGLAILYTLAAQFGVAALKPARGALRQGVIFDLAERHAAATDMRDVSVRLLQRRFEVDTAQAARVARVADRLWRSVDRPAPPEARAAREERIERRRELGWAAALHEIGMMVSHHDHHRHSAYLIAHVDAPGFSQSQQRRIADLALAQRGGLRKVEAALAEDAFAWQALSLRLAVISCQDRASGDAPLPRLRRDGTTAALDVPARWERTQPRVLYLLGEEAVAWQAGGPLRLEVRHG